MAQATVAPAEMVSMPARLSSSLSSKTLCASSFMHSPPRASTLSYSGLWVSEYFPSMEQIPPQPRGHE